MNWRTDKPTEDVIVAQLSSDFAARKRYTILSIATKPYKHYHEDSPLTYCVQDKKAKYDAVLFGANLQMQKMMKDAKSGIDNYDNYIKFDDGTYIDLDPSMSLKSSFAVKAGERVKVIVIKEG